MCIIVANAQNAKFTARFALKVVGAAIRLSAMTTARKSNAYLRRLMLNSFSEVKNEKPT